MRTNELAAREAELSPIFGSLVAGALGFELGLRSLGQFARATGIRQGALVPRIALRSFSFRQLLLRHPLLLAVARFSAAAISHTLKSRAPTSVRSIRGGDVESSELKAIERQL
jgi:hypothetical protein